MCDAVALTGSTCADIVSSSEHERSDDDSAAHVNGSVTGYRSPAPVVSSLKRVHAKRDMPAAQGVRSHLAPIRQASISVPTRWALLLCLRSAVVVKVLQIMDTKLDEVLENRTRSSSRVHVAYPLQRHVGGSNRSSGKRATWEGPACS
jgi:hypothetical protein